MSCMHYHRRDCGLDAIKEARHHGLVSKRNINPRQKNQEKERRQNKQYPGGEAPAGAMQERSEEHTSELQSLMRNSYAVFCLKKKKTHKNSKHLALKSTINTIHNIIE